MCSVRGAFIVKKAIVLAAGLGTRLRPLTCAVPKPLMPIWGEQMLARIVRMLREWGVDDIVVNCHYLHEQIERWCAENGCKASYEPTILGTGGVLNPLRDWIKDEPFYLVNGDIVVEGAKRLELPADDSVIGCCLVSQMGPRTIEVEPEYGYVTNWRSDDAGMEGTWTYCGIAALKPAILNYVEREGEASIVSAYTKAMMDGRFIKAIAPDDLLWEDAGSIERYIELNHDDKDNAFADIPALKAAGATASVEFIDARGSERVFFKDGDKVFIIYDDAKRKENSRYAGHARWLKAKGIPVPSVIAELPEWKTIVMENAGSERKFSLEEYVKIVEGLVKFNALGAEKDMPELEPPFDMKIWTWEQNLFAEHCLQGRYFMEMPKAVSDELKNVASLLEREPKALVHRDFQSTNVLWKNGDFNFIDFQGMRLGPAAYDLASLVYDPYVRFTEGERRALIKLYARTAGREEIVNIMPYAAVERLVQCLGAYGRLASVGQTQFEKYVLPALENLLDVADKANLDALGGLAEDLIAKESPHHCHHHHHE